MYCNQSDFINNNEQFSDWYVQNYSFLSNDSLASLVGFANSSGSIFPDMQQLLTFYNNDSQIRNITPITNIQNCYELLFDYYLANYQTWSGGTYNPSYTEPTPVQRVISNLPEVVQSTVSDLSKTLNFSLTTIYTILGLVLAILIVWLFIKSK